MEDWVIIISFTYPHEAHLAKGMLENEGIEVMLKDELTVQVNNFYSNAIGGVKLLVKDSDYRNAYTFLTKSRYIIETNHTPGKLYSRFDKLTSKLPFIGNSMVELRMLIVVALALVIIIVPIVILSLPSTFKKLTGNSWCVNKIYYKGKELIPNSYGLRVVDMYSNCSETMYFSKLGTVTFPGINSYLEEAHWELKNDSLIISEWSYQKKHGLNKDIHSREKEDKVEKSIYFGSYSLKIKSGVIVMRSDSLTIIGSVENHNFNF